ncbi:UDP-glycosyltransferase UGT5-like [Aricia agestis]|uniref:UDP-glycosyltransferase UGT5-like n=1 Tax=Aricia agestis TaxID=91739 RepID=UPI001C205E49|nr:UDP-glycosyltransferase UGT5-like [Aricia agestis]
MYNFLLVLLLCQHAYSLNILAVVSLPLRSHYTAFQRLFEELSRRGHSVTVMNNYPQNETENLQFVDLTVERPSMKPLPPMSQHEQVDPRYARLMNLYNHIVRSPVIAEEDCENFFTNDNVKALRASGKKFDVIFVEEFVSDCGLAFAAVTYDAPIIGITSHTLLPWTYSRLGIPFDIASDAFYFSPHGTNPSFWGKIENFLMHKLLFSIGRWYMQRSLYRVFNKHLPGVSLDVEVIGKERMKMVFVYQHHSVTGARLASPQLVEIGGSHIHQSKPVSKEIENFLSNAKDGAIYVSFGSNLNANTMSRDKMQQFLQAFEKIPQKVLWKLDNVTLPMGSGKIYTNKWFSQLDVLCHPKVIGFISHGGMLSLSEAAHCGKPLITIPFFGDQFSNAAAAAEVGIAITMTFQQLDADSLLAAIRRLTSPKIQQSAKRVSKLWHDRPMDVLDNAIYWTEYVARHREAPPALPSKNSSWFQLLLLDVYSVLIALLVFVFLFLYFVAKVIASLLKICLSNKDKKD